MPTVRPSYASKVPIGWIIQLYKADAMGRRDIELGTPKY